MSKTIKYLADGTIAKVGMIVYSESLDRITKITKIILPGKSLIATKVILVKCDEHLGITLYTKIPSWWTFTRRVRRATPEERKQYYKNLK